MNPFVKQNYLILYHAHCLDGITAATITYKYLLESDVMDTNIVTRAVNYTDPLEDIIACISSYRITDIYIVDFSFKKEDLYLLSEGVNNIRLIDHHASAFRNLVDENYEVKKDSVEQFIIKDIAGMCKIQVILNNNESGASLCYKSLIDPCIKGDSKLPRLVRYVKDYDLYRFTYRGTKAVNKYLKMQEKSTYRFLSLLHKFEDADFHKKVIITGESILQYEESLEEELISAGKTPIYISGVSGLCVNAPGSLASSIGTKLAGKSGTFGATWFQAANGGVKFSLRSIGDSCDVGKLAETMGGGGHKNAAGFSMNAPAYDMKNGITLWNNTEDSSDDNHWGLKA